MTTFNPFKGDDESKKEIRELKFSDIETLKENNIPEGAYIEYKSDFQSPIKIAHSIASFANMYGGWYIIGIKTDDDNVPNDFPGFELSKHPNPKETIRNIAVSHINPFPLFDSKLIKVDDERWILAVLIHESLEPPHITKDGRIYRRNGEGGDPVVESDRYAIDRLYDRSKRFKGIVEDFCQNKIVISEAQSRQGWLEIYLMTYPLGKLSIDNFLGRVDIDSIKTLLDSQSAITYLYEHGEATGNVPFNNVATSSNSIIFRQTTPFNLKDLTLTFEFYKNGNAKVIIPFQYIDILQELPTFYKDSKNVKLLRESLGEEEDMFRIIDGFNLFSCFLLILGKYFELLKREEWNEKIVIKYRLENCWRSILFFDSKAFTEQTEKYGVPISQKDVIVIPDTLSGDNWFIRSFDDISNEVFDDFALITMSLGFHLTSVVEAITKDLTRYCDSIKGP
jgi:hypothetical protein